ncbi:MAG: hypothetical protein Q9173_004850 [Seirophora scorigena]
MRVLSFLAILLLTSPHLVLCDPSPNFQCVNWVTWELPAFRPEDCLLATHVIMQTAEAFPDRRFEFVRDRSRGTCKLVIMPFRDAEFVPGGPDAQDMPRFDDDSGINLARLAKELYVMCARQGKPGWITAGSHGALGLFFWASRSVKDQQIGNTTPDMIRIARNRANATDPAVDTA